MKNNDFEILEITNCNTTILEDTKEVLQSIKTLSSVAYSWYSYLSNPQKIIQSVVGISNFGDIAIKLEKIYIGCNLIIKECQDIYDGLYSAVNKISFAAISEFALDSDVNIDLSGQSSQAEIVLQELN